NIGGQLYRIRDADINGTTGIANSGVYGTAASIRQFSGSCSSSSSNANGWLLETTTAAAVGIPATIVPPLQLP
ncbi:MAG: hypothetical protein AAFY60_14300, partial [Myxococcota bacterium]